MSRTVAVGFTNFGPYHLARLRALAAALEDAGDRLVAYETSGSQAIYPWETVRRHEPFEWMTLFPDRELEEIPRSACVEAIRSAMNRDEPDVLCAVGYFRPEAMAMLEWALAHGCPAVLMSESQEIDHPRVWWKEAVKRRRVRKFSAGLVGGERHRDYLVSLGMPRDRITLGYNAVDGERFAADAQAFRDAPDGRAGLPNRPYFLAVNRFVPEKNLVRLIEAYTIYRGMSANVEPWDLVVCGDGPGSSEVERAISASRLGESIHRPGFLQAGALSQWYAFATAFVHPSSSEPWGLVVNEASACGLPLLVSDRAGCVETFIPDTVSTTGFRLDVHDAHSMAAALDRLASLPVEEREAMGLRAAAIAREWGPQRFARGTIEAIELAEQSRTSRKQVIAG